MGEEDEEEPDQAPEEEAEEPEPPMQLRCVLQIYNVGEGFLQARRVWTEGLLKPTGCGRRVS